MSETSATIKDVAKMAKVSVATVSRVINKIQINKVSPHTRKRVIKAIDALNYRPNFAARSLSKRETSHIGIVIPFSAGLFGEHYYSQLLKGIMEEINKLNYSLTLYDANFLCNDLDSPLREGRVDGLLIIAPNIMYLEKLTPFSKRVVLLNATYSKSSFSSADCDNKTGAEKSTEYLINLGHKAIGCITGPMKNPNARERLQGYTQALKKNNINYSEKLVVNGDFVFDKGLAAARKLLNLKPRPTAIVCSNDTMAFACMEAAREKGIKIPDSLSLVGFDDVNMASITQPALTTVRQPIIEIVRSGVRLLFEQINSEKFEPQHIKIPVEIVFRNSCRDFSNSKTARQQAL